MESGPRQKTGKVFLTRFPWLTCAIPAFVGLIVSIVYLARAEAVWFDDPYIFFQYARNLAEGCGLTFNPGEISFGATSILWPLLVALVTRLTGFNVILVAQCVGVLLYAGSAGILAIAVQQATGRPWIGALAASLYVAYPSAVKLGISGMEVGLTLFLLALILVTLLSKRGPVWLLGILGGLAFLSRPDAIVLVPSLLVWLYIQSRLEGRNSRAFLLHTVALARAYAIVIGPWLVYLFVKTGAFLPTTQVGKLLLWLPVLYNLNYEQYASLNMLERFTIAFGSFSFFLDYRHLVLLLALGNLPISLLRKYSLTIRSTALVGFLYSLGVPLLYGITFPLFTFRYVTGMFLFGFFAVAVWFNWMYHNLVQTILRTALSRQAVIAVSLLFVLLSYGGMHFISFPNYLWQVQQQVIRVKTGRWLQQNTPSTATIAVEPIGAIGFYAERYIVDMGGLINAEANILMPNGCSSPTNLGRFVQVTHPTFLADCSGLCLGKLALEKAGYAFDTVFSLESDHEQVVGCSIYYLEGQ